MSVICVCEHHADDHDPACEIVDCDCRLFRTGFEEWRNHIPSGYADMSDYGHVSCSCGWDSSNGYNKKYPSWEEHIDAAVGVLDEAVKR